MASDAPAASRRVLWEAGAAGADAELPAAGFRKPAISVNRPKLEQGLFPRIVVKIERADKDAAEPVSNRRQQ